MRAKFERRKERFEEGLKRNKPNTEKKRRRTATKRNGTEDEAEVSAFTVDGEASASTKEERRRDLGNMLGGSSKRKRSEIAWDEESFELRDDGDDEVCIVIYTMYNKGRADCCVPRDCSCTTRAVLILMLVVKSDKRSG